MYHLLSIPHFMDITSNIGDHRSHAVCLFSFVNLEYMFRGFAWIYMKL